MTSQYKHAVKLVGFSEDRKGELVNYLKHLHPREGMDFFNALLKELEGGGERIIHKTNSIQDAHRTVFTIHSHGGFSEVIEDFNA